MVVSDATVFVMLAVFVALFLYKEFGTSTKFFSSVMLVVIGIGMLWIDPDYGFGGWIMFAGGFILLINTFFAKGKRGKRI